MRFPPPIVAQTDASRLAPSRVKPLSLGLVPWENGELTTVVLKVAYTFDPRRSEQVVTLAAEQPALVHEHRSSLERGVLDSELESPMDLVHAKIAADVLLVGHAYSHQPSERIDARIRIPERMERAFSAVGTAHDRIPLRGGYLRDTDGETPIPPVGPCGPRLVIAPKPEVKDGPTTTDRIAQQIAAGDLDPTRPLAPQLEAAADPEEPAGEIEIDDEDLELMWEDLVEENMPLLERGVQHAAAASTSPLFFLGDEVIELDGLTVGGGRRVLRLAGHEPQVIFETQDDTKLWPLMLCDTVSIDTDTNTVTLTWRGQITVDALASPTNRIVMGLTRMGGKGLLSHLYRDLQRGHFARAEVLGGAPSPLTDGRDIELELARYQTFDRSPEPLLSLADYARVTAEILGADDRAAVLARHGMNDDDWMLEERGWMERVGRAMARGDLELPMAFNLALAEARAVQGGDA